MIASELHTRTFRVASETDRLPFRDQLLAGRTCSQSTCWRGRPERCRRDSPGEPTCVWCGPSVSRAAIPTDARVPSIAVRALETALFCASFALVLVGAGLLLVEVRTTRAALEEVARVARGVPRPDDSIRERTRLALDDANVARSALATLASTVDGARRADRLGAWLAGSGAACALAASLLAVWS